MEQNPTQKPTDNHRIIHRLHHHRICSNSISSANNFHFLKQSIELMKATLDIFIVALINYTFCDLPLCQEAIFRRRTFRR
jgi:hypothetical protein